MMMHHRSLLGAAIALAAALSASRGFAESPTAWPADRAAELKRLDTELLDCQRQRFAALFSKDQSAVKGLNERFAELQKQRRELLTAAGQM